MRKLWLRFRCWRLAGQIIELDDLIEELDARAEDARVEQAKLVNEQREIWRRMGVVLCDKDIQESIQWAPPA
jgi:hypothetical protein